MLVTDKVRLRWSLVVLFILGGLGFYQFRTRVYEEGWIATPQTQAAEVAGWIGLSILLVFTLFSWLGGEEFILSWLKRIMNWLQHVRWIALPGLVSLYLLYLILVMGHHGIHLEMPFVRIFFYVIFVLAGAVMLSVWKQDRTWAEMLPVSFLLLAAVYNAASYLPNVSTYPLALGWSETSRYYYSSTFFSESIYGQDLPWPHNHFSRYLMQAAPFFFPALPLWAHRLWQVMLQIVFPYFTGFVLSRRLKLGTRRETLLLTLWAGLFFFQGPVFYQMLVMVMLVLALFDSRRVWRSFIVVVLASIWAGFTRINWVPMPGLIAAALYFMERQVEGRDTKAIASYLLPPALWVAVGGGVGWVTQNWYFLNSGLPREVIFGFIESELLWYRLWPNLSYRPGILPGILLVSGPGLVFVLLTVRGWKKRWHPLRLLGLGAMLLVLFVGGLVVSVKIGGGTNLHNLDAYLIVLLMVLVYLYYGKFVNACGEERPQRPAWFHLNLIVIIPALFAVLFGGQVAKLDFEMAERVLDRIQLYVDQAGAKEGEILFVTQRHLITFDIIERVELVHDYEKMILMEMAMAGDQAYLDMFAKDLEARRFSLIIHGRLPVRVKKVEKHALAEESNVYLDRVGALILCYYELEEEIIEAGINLFVPKTNQGCD